MKGLIPAGGTGTRLAPCTQALNKHLLPVYNKPMIYYPIALLIEMGVTEILITSHLNEIPLFQSLLGDGSRLGVKIHYKEQKTAGGIAETLLLADDFIKNGERFIMCLGDNIFNIPNTVNSFSPLLSLKEGAGLILCPVVDPSRFGVAEIGSNGSVISLEEKPLNPRSSLAVTGIYFYDRLAIEFAGKIKRSGRGELEITDVNIEYLKRGLLTSITLSSDSFWGDTGTIQSLFLASTIIKNSEEKEGMLIGCPEEAALNMGRIKKEELSSYLHDKKGEYYDYLRKICK